MIEVATGYFVRAKAYHEMGYSLVSIAHRRPWFIPDGIVLHDYGHRLSPTAEILEMKDRPDDYEPRYRKDVLEYISPEEVMGDLEMFAFEDKLDKVILMCYEGSGKFCHRHIVGKWLAEGLGIEVREISPKSIEEWKRKEAQT